MSPLYFQEVLYPKMYTPMRLFKILLLLLPILLCANCKKNKDQKTSTNLNITFKEEESYFTMEQKNHISKVVRTSEKDIRDLLPTLPDSIQVVFEIVDWELDPVGGVTGRTETNSPPLVAIQISNSYPGGITAAVNKALKHVVYHEFHHLYRGWAIKDNLFEPGIAIAAVNEGLAVVFSEKYTHLSLETDSPPREAIANQWVKEILKLPRDANYQEWMFQHPDGRSAIGYRAGNFLIRKAMAQSSMNILKISTLTPSEILKLGGY